MQIVIEINDIPKNDHERWVLEHGTPLPKGHGRLIDIDAVWDEYPNKPFIECITETPTIIEADKGDKE